MSFEELKHKAKEEWDALQQSEKPRILIGAATCGRSAGALDVLQTLKKHSESQDIDAHIIEVGCIGLCYAEPLVTIIKSGRPGICYGNVDSRKAAQLIEDYIINDNPLSDYALGTVGDGSIDGIPNLFHSAVLKPQVRRVLRNCGFIDPTNINHYLAHKGYSGFLKALKVKPERIIEEVKKSGLRGRGGAGFPTWRKWQFCREAKGAKKYIICNADEGDPGAFMNR